ncbi:MAG: RDD family protein [Bacillota bacterium]|nr:RDD family protein [Bacillota bacterium]
MRRIREVITPENVFIEFELAGIGSRLLAFLIDFAIQCLAMIIMVIIVSALGFSFSEAGSFKSYFVALGVVITFLIYNGYFIFFEMFMNGQSPGKKLAKLKVIRETGESITLFDSVLRNILRTVDFLPSFYLIGSIVVVFNNNYKRIGDVAANTVVIKNRKNEKLVTANELISNRNGGNISELKNIYPVTESEFSALKEFMERKECLGEKKSLFTYHLNMYFLKKFNMEIRHRSPYDFFEDILRMNKD